MELAFAHTMTQHEHASLRQSLATRRFITSRIFLASQEMRKRNPSKVFATSNPSGSRLADDSNVTRNELFTFPNGDRYEGGYNINGEQPFLVRQGRGVYDTDDFNRYEATWDRDKIGSDLHIRFNNGMEYKGYLGEDGSMSGPGTYCFPDGSSIQAIWKGNKPVIEIIYKEPLGYSWKGELSEDEETVRFMAGNHFWDDMCISECPKFEDEAITDDNQTSEAFEDSETNGNSQNPKKP